MRDIFLSVGSFERRGVNDVFTRRVLQMGTKNKLNHLFLRPRVCRRRIRPLAFLPATNGANW